MINDLADSAILRTHRRYIASLWAIATQQADAILLGRRCFGCRAGLLAGFVVALNPLFFGTARQMTMDIHQSLWFAVAMVCFYLGFSASEPRGKRWYLGFWASCGMGFMAKSVPGLIPILAALVFVVIQERFRLRRILDRIWEARPLAWMLLL